MKWCNNIFDKLSPMKCKNITILTKNENKGWDVFVLPTFDGVRRYPPRLKYWMPIHYDTIKDGQNKNSHFLFSKWAASFHRYHRDCHIFAQWGGSLCSKKCAQLVFSCFLTPQLAEAKIWKKVVNSLSLWSTFRPTRFIGLFNTLRYKICGIFDLHASLWTRILGASEVSLIPVHRYKLVTTYKSCCGWYVIM